MIQFAFGLGRQYGSLAGRLSRLYDVYRYRLLYQRLVISVTNTVSFYLKHLLEQLCC